ncbi:MAG: fasciclin domain-containing protein [Caulobacteraceae bacterium]
MRLSPLFAAAAAAALIVSPALAAADAPTTTAPAASAPAAPAAPSAAPALPSIPKVAAGANIYDTLKDSGQFTILVKALDQSGLAQVLEKYPNLTFFAPTDQALNALPPDVLAKLMAPNDTSANQLQQILKYHLINAQVDSSKIRGAKGPVTTVESQPVVLDGSNPADLMVNNADIIQADVRTGNGGIVNVIDKVLIPSDSPYAALAAPAHAAAPAQGSASAAPAESAHTPAGT